MKITQPQLRIVRAMLRGKAQDAVSAAQIKAKENHTTNNKLIHAACAKVLKKYEKQIVKSVQPDIERIRRGYNSPVTVECDDEIVEKIRAECNAAIADLPIIGTETLVHVEFPALGMTSEYSRREENAALQVPSNEVAKWKDLARDIDSSFMDGDAKKLAWVVGNFK